MAREGWKRRILLAVVLTLAGGSAAWSAKLDKAACAAIASEIDAIASAGIKEDMERGPEWARANMPSERLEKVRRLLELSDQLEFRCPGRLKPKKPEQTVSPAAPTPPVSVSGAQSAGTSRAAAASVGKAAKDAAPVPERKSSVNDELLPAAQAPGAKASVTQGPPAIRKPAAQATAPNMPAAARPAPPPATKGEPPLKAGSSAAPATPAHAGGPATLSDTKTTPAPGGRAAAIPSAPSAAGHALRAFKPAPPAGLGVRPAQVPAAVAPVAPAKITPPVTPPAVKSAVTVPAQGTAKAGVQPVPGATAAVAAKSSVAVAPSGKIAPLPATAAIGPTPGSPKPIAPELPAASSQTAPEPEKPAAEAAPRKKSAWRKPSSAYVSPSEVSPFLLPGMR